jgi:hypothetical protein
MYPTRCGGIVAAFPRTAPSALAPLKPRAAFHASARANVKVGDSLPNLGVLHESSPGTKINLAKELTGKGLVIGVPAAFSMCFRIQLLSSDCVPSISLDHPPHSTVARLESGDRSRAVS